jgi:endo-1,4-beta-xylanase
LKYFGSATDNGELSDSSYVSHLSNTNDFGQITPGNSMKVRIFPISPPKRKALIIASGALLNQVKTNTVMDKEIKLPTSQSQTANFFVATTWFGINKHQIGVCFLLLYRTPLLTRKTVTSGSWSNSSLIAAVQQHIQSEVTHYKGQCYAWDVVNEALNDDGTYRSWQLYNVIGPAYIPIAFEAAAAADPSAKLYYNDYNIEYAGAKSTGAQNLVKTIKAYGARIDGIGLESHFIAGQTPSATDQAANMAAFVALGVEVAVTELDVRMTLPETSSGDQQQAKDYVSTVTACLNTKGCIGVTVWDFDDKYSWVPGTFSGQGAACLYNSNLQQKPAYTSVLSLLNAYATSGSSSATTTFTSTAATTTTPIITTTPSTTSSAPATTSSSTGAGSVAQWGQCGGIGWTGGTACVSPYTCHYSNPYYSQCY